jgi:hypothetical protein
MALLSCCVTALVFLELSAESFQLFPTLPDEFEVVQSRKVLCGITKALTRLAQSFVCTCRLPL